MNNRRSHFYSHFFVFFGFENILFHNHLNFFENFFYFLINNQELFFNNYTQVTQDIITIFYNYVSDTMTGSSLKKYFFAIISFLQKHIKSPKIIYTYCIELCSVIFFLACHPLAVIEFNHISYDDTRLHNQIRKICEKYHIKPKIILVLNNKTLLKGMQLFFKNKRIDSSLKTILYCYKKKILNT